MAKSYRINEFRKELRKHTVVLIVSAFGFVTALTWNSAIQTLLETLIPVGEEIIFKFITAIIVTIVAVAAIMTVSHFKPKE